jgi:trehalose-6-phosphate synthase
VEGTAGTLYKALRLRRSERATRMRTLRAEVEKHDVFWWADRFLKAAQPTRSPTRS